MDSGYDDQGTAVAVPVAPGRGSVPRGGPAGPCHTSLVRIQFRLQADLKLIGGAASTRCEDRVCGLYPGGCNATVGFGEPTVRQRIIPGGEILMAGPVFAIIRRLSGT
jgi:hypothetical protein